MSCVTGLMPAPSSHRLMVRRNKNRHAIQIEINRALYMNERTLEKTTDFGDLKRAAIRLCTAI